MKKGKKIFENETQIKTIKQAGFPGVNGEINVEDYIEQSETTIVPKDVEFLNRYKARKGNLRRVVSVSNPMNFETLIVNTKGKKIKNTLGGGGYRETNTASIAGESNFNENAVGDKSTAKIKTEGGFGESKTSVKGTTNVGEQNVTGDKNVTKEQSSGDFTKNTQTETGNETVERETVNGSKNITVVRNGKNKSITVKE